MTIEQMRLLLGLGPEVSDASVVAAYAASLDVAAGEIPEPIIKLAAVKQHLRIEADETEEDAYLNLLILAALRSIENQTGRDMHTSLTTLSNDDRTVVGQAMLLLIGHWYANREAVGKDGGEMPLAVHWLLMPLKKWVC